LVAMILYHFPTSAFARRIRLMLAHKKIRVELRDARKDAAFREDVHRLNPMRTIPVLVDIVDGEELAIVDSNAISQYLDRKIALPPLWPFGIAGADAFEITAMTDRVVHLLADFGIRCAPFHGETAFVPLRKEIVSRVQGTLDALAKKATKPFTCGDNWSGADMALFTMTTWLEALPVRAPHFPPAKSILDLGWSLPKGLSTWADIHRPREDVIALGPAEG
jgi:glutathione S-transferase